MDFRSPISIWAVTAGTSESRRWSASGGLAHELGRHFISERKGVVAGVKWDRDFNAVFSLEDSVDGLELFRGSKYVYCKLEKDFLARISGFVEKGTPVLFIGLPCHVAAVRTIFGESVTTVDILCHGTVSPEYLKQELQFLKIVDAGNISFRENVCDDYHFRVYRGGKTIMDLPAIREPYFNAFLNGMGLRESCYSCAYARPERVGDITIGDFINLGKPYMKDGVRTCVNADAFTGHVSFCSINTEKGKALFDGLDGIVKQERDYEERLSYKPSLLCPTNRPAEDKIFRFLLRALSYPRAMRTALFFMSARRIALQFYVGVKRKLGIKGALLHKKH